MNNMNAVTPIGFVMIADDDQDDIEILTAALKETNSSLEVVVANNGKTVLEHLKKMQGSGSIPCVLVMDMNMPQMDGRETVVAIKSDTGLKDLPILLFSTAKNRTDELFAEKWSVHFFQKPDSVQGLANVANVIIAMCREKGLVA